MQNINKTIKGFIIFVFVFMSSIAWAGLATEAPGATTIPIPALPTALAGNDATTYFTQSKPMIGSSNYVVRIAGKNYQFVNQQNMEKFKQDPKRYMPQFDGKCAYALALNKVMKGNPNVYTVHDGKLYFFKNKLAMNSWLTNANKNISSGTKNWENVIEREKAIPL